MKTSAQTGRIRDEEWDFRAVPDERLAEACVYEYCRSHDGLKRAVHEYKPSALDSDALEQDVLVRARAINIEGAHRRGKGIHRNGIAAADGRKDPANNRSEKLRDVWEIFIRHRQPGQEQIPFRNYDRVITLSKGFLKFSFLSDPNALGLLKIHDGITLPAVLDLKGCYIGFTLDRLAHLRRFFDSKFSGAISTTLSEPNGSPLQFSREDPYLRKFTLGIDFSRTEAELREAFGQFIKEARKNYAIPLPDVSDRPVRGSVPSWLNGKFCAHALNALGAYRICDAFAEDYDGAFTFVKERIKVKGSDVPGDFHYSSKKELRRAAARYHANSKMICGS